MAYASEQDMVDRFGADELIQLTDRDGLGVVDSALVAQALADASDVIDGHLAGRYALPLATVPGVLRLLCCDIARFLLHDDRATEAVERRHRDALAYLERVASGAVALGLSDDGQRAAGSDGAQVLSAGRVFGRDQGGFV